MLHDYVTPEERLVACMRSDWLSAADGPFSLYLRAYRPEQDILDGTWTPRPLIRLG
jgi:hypothetical protein